ncbi:MAG: phage tail tape measure protein [Candidatus Pacebacteria bacterium]|nr:phage tail tape measure protein [Candidatus Paceibacterota bacterium]
MANILLKAILDTSDVTKQISTLHKDLTKGSNLKEGLNLFSKGSIEKSTNDLKLMRHHLRAFENETAVLKRKGLFGDTTSIKKREADFQKMFGIVDAKKGLISADSGLGKFREQINKTDVTLQKLKNNALSFKSNQFKNIWQQEGATGLLLRATSGDKEFEKFRNPRVMNDIRRLYDLEPQLRAMENMRMELGHIEAKAVKVGTTMKDSFKPLINFFNNLGVAGNTLFNIFGTLIAKVGTWLVATTMLYGFIKGITTLTKEMKNLQDAEFNLRRILNGTNEEIDKGVKLTFDFAKNMNALAGATYKDTIDAFTGAKKAGFDFADSLYITRTALLGVNVAELETESATRYLISTIRQFNMNASSSLGIMNQWNELGQETGATTKDIAEAVSRAGGVFKAAGGSLHQLNAIASIAIESTGESGEKIGTMLKTLSSRYMDMSMRKSLAAELRPLGIEIYNKEKGEYNSIFEVLAKLSDQWGTLEQKKESAIGKAGAGTRQVNRLYGILNNYDKVMKAYAISINSNNSVLEENAKRVTTLDFAQRRLNGAVSEMARSKGSMAVLQGMTWATMGLTASLNFLTTTSGKVVLALTAITVAAKILTAANIKLALSFAIANPAIATMIAMGAAIAFLGIRAEYARQRQIGLNSAIYDSTKAAYDNRMELQKGGEAFLKSYAKLDPKNEEGAALRKTYSDMFKNVAGIDIDKKFNEAAKSGKRLSDAITEIVTELKNLNTVKFILDDVKNSMKDARKEGKDEKYNKKVEEMSSILYNTFGDKSVTAIKEDLDAIKLLTEKTFGKKTNTQGIQKKLNDFSNSLKEIGGSEGTSLQASIDEIKGIKKTNIQSSGLAVLPSNLETLTESLEAKFLKGLEELNITTKDGNRLSMSDLTDDKYTILSDMLDKIFKINQDELDKDILRRKNEEAELINKKRTHLLKIIESYYDSEYEKAKATYDKIKALNDSMVSSFNEGLLDLSEGVTFGQRIENAFSGVGDTLFSTLVGDINKQISDALTGEAPKSMAEMLKEAMEIGGTKAEKSILDGFIASVGTLDDAMKVWQDRLAYAVQGKTSEDLTKAGINLALPGKSIATTRRDQLIAEYEARLKGLSGNGGNRVLQGSEDISKWLKETLFGKAGKDGAAATKGLLSGFEGLETIGKDAFSGMGLGAYAAGMAGKDATAGGGLGGLFAAIGGTMGPAGALLGGIIGGLIAPDKKKDEEEKQKEQINYAKQSQKELQLINRNTSAMVDELKNFSLMQDSYYFSFSNSANRGVR